ncbi:hypothetical protein GCM10010272_00910 [Streptomyces lateritius]|nr:hypothetical protein GCM10010272_00910 [Streptomyces lateritius]
MAAVDRPDEAPAGDAVHIEADPPGGGVAYEVTDLGQWLHESPPSRNPGVTGESGPGPGSLEIHPDKPGDPSLSTYL